MLIVCFTYFFFPGELAMQFFQQGAITGCNMLNNLYMNSLVPMSLLPIIFCRSSKNSRNNNEASSHHHDTSNSNSNDKTIDRVMIGLGILAVIVFIYGILLPGPEPDNPMLEFQINSVNVNVTTNDNNVGDYYSIVRKQKLITADLEFNVTLKTLDEISMYYTPLQVSLFDDELFLSSSTVLEPFFLLNNHRDLQFGMRINGEWGGEINNKVVHQFALKLKAKGDFLRWRGYIQKCGLSVVCDDIKVGNWTSTTTGTLIVSPVFCQCKPDCPQVLVFFT